EQPRLPARRIGQETESRAAIERERPVEHVRDHLVRHVRDQRVPHHGLGDLIQHDHQHGNGQPCQRTGFGQVAQADFLAPPNIEARMIAACVHPFGTKRVDADRIRRAASGGCCSTKSHPLVALRARSRRSALRRRRGRKSVDTMVHAFTNTSRAFGRIASTQRVYCAPEGCNPSATRSSREPGAREIVVTSIQCAPTLPVSAHAAALKASISRATHERSRPSSAANGVMPQSGIDTTITCPALPPASSLARCSSSRNCPRYSSSDRPRYWLLTPISSVTRP